MLEASTSSTSSKFSTVTHLTPSHDYDDSYRLFDKELKCLFLHSRDPSRLAFEQLVNKIFGIETYKKKAKDLVKDAGTRFNDYRNKFNDSVASHVKKLREADER